MKEEEEAREGETKREKMKEGAALLLGVGTGCNIGAILLEYISGSMVRRPETAAIPQTVSITHNGR